MHISLRRLLILTAAIYLITAGVFWATAVNTLTIFPSIDSYSWESVPNANNGGSDNFAITSAAANPKNMRGWIAFDISAVPDNVWIVNAKLRLRVWHKTTTAEGCDTTGRVYGVYRVTQPWREYNVTWANQPNYTDDHHATSPVPQGQGGWFGPLLYMDWDVTGILKDWLSGAANYGVVVRDLNEYSPVQCTTQFFTHNKTPDSSYYPRLVVSYVRPESVLILLAVLVAEGLFIMSLSRMQRTRRR